MSTIHRARNGDTYRDKEWIGVIDRTLEQSWPGSSKWRIAWKVYDYEGLYCGAFTSLALAKNRLDLLSRR
jgi:hypothetical protein